MPEAEKKAPKKKVPKKIGISGRVLDGEGEGIVDALVEFLETGLRTYTDAQGKYSLTDVPPGEDTIRVIATGFIETRQPLDLAQRLENYDITLEST